MTDHLVTHYADGPGEATRLTRSPHGRLEYLRTRELLRQELPGAPARVLDVGGATGVHAAWLARGGYSVCVVDPVPGHVAEAAALPGVEAEVGDARELSAPDGSADVVLVLGPLYHLRECSERALALSQARRVLRPGGLLAAAGISRYLSALEVGTNGGLTARLEPSIMEVIDTGSYDGHVGFVPAHFHTAEELGAEVTAAGFTDVRVHGVEGPSWMALDVAGAEEFDVRLDAALRLARLVERDPLLINASAHFLAFARR
jgi:SAM-dependent methyltransferase